MRKSILATLLCGLLVSACGDNNKSTTLENNIETSPASVFVASFDPTNSVIPYPNNLLFQGSTDGTLNIPVADANNYSDPQVALNTVDGFSTMAPMSTGFSSTIDAATVVAGDTVRVFQVTLSGTGGAVVAVNAELTANVDYAVSLSPVDASQSTLVISPLRALAPSTSYLVVIDNGIKDAAGYTVRADTTYALAKSSSALVDGQGNSLYPALTDAQAGALEPLRQLTNAAEAAVVNYTITADAGNAIADLPSADIVLSWSFTTQSIGNVLGAVQSAATAQPVSLSNTGMTTNDVNSNLPGIADIYVGTVDMPYYLTGAASAYDTAPLNDFWHAAGGAILSPLNSVPVATSTESIPLLVTLPNAGSGKSKPGAGWPVVIFQHGITESRTNALAVADTLAQAGFAVVAIDLPLHGITDTSNPLYQAGRERTFDLDLMNNATMAAGPDGTIDDSGSYFINLANLAVTRDNVREGIGDLFTLYRSLGNIPDVNPSDVYFVGHSLGAMEGSVFVAMEPSVKAAVLAMPGGGIGKLLDGSVKYGPIIAAGLASAGVNKGSADYESFVAAAQTLVDSGDPLNYAADTVDGRGVLLFEVVGGSGALPDQIIPNNVMALATPGTVPSPTAGTDPLAAAMGLTVYSGSAAGSQLHGWMRFTEGDHASLLLPDASMATITEMQSEMAAFLASNGAAIVVSNGSILETAP